MNFGENRPIHADIPELSAMRAPRFGIWRRNHSGLANEALKENNLFGAFVIECCGCWTGAGKPSEVDDVYDRPADAPPELPRRGQNRINGSEMKV